MKEVRLALIGYGNVAQGLTQILHDRGDEYAQKYGVHFIITAICDPVKGTAFDPDGLSPALLLDTVQRGASLDDMPGIHPGWDAIEMIQNSPSDVIVEMSYTDLKTGEPAHTYMAEALRRKKHVVTSNKGPITLHYDALAAIARLHGVQIGVEGTVMSGTPVIHMGRMVLVTGGINRIQGILNGTTNYILTQMEAGNTYQNALAEAQRLGYAEADPTGDVEGYDSAAKIAILSRLVLGNEVQFQNVERQGISQLTADDIASARAEGKHWKLVGTLNITSDGVRASVRPECLSEDHPLARINGATNALVYSSDLLGDVTIIGPGAGRVETGYALLQDLFCLYSIRTCR